MKKEMKKSCLRQIIFWALSLTLLGGVFALQSVEVQAASVYQLTVNETSNYDYTVTLPTQLRVGTILSKEDEITAVHEGFNNRVDTPILDIWGNDRTVFIQYWWQNSHTSIRSKFRPFDDQSSIGAYKNPVAAYNEFYGTDYDYLIVVGMNPNDVVPDIYVTGYTPTGTTSTGKEAPRKSAFERTVDGHINAISHAKSGATIVIKGDESFNALPNSVMKELLKKKEVSLQFHYVYKGMEYNIVIPAGGAEDNQIPWYGPMYLWGKYGVSSSPVTSGN